MKSVFKQEYGLIFHLFHETRVNSTFVKNDHEVIYYLLNIKKQRNHYLIMNFDKNDML